MKNRDRIGEEKGSHLFCTDRYVIEEGGKKAKDKIVSLHHMTLLVGR